ncbi:YrhA family protein [Volucribacter amazonae]|uniref:SMI1/KNR4 family protein n=1 Tax=Volucribacter amazonae TaxID=256731 RepID=A0A9X4P9E9_9PAST|nr:YrhA family protein [Volucribacter amazonae]MDG6894092.1 hypothetical protein [Volucribacter amazonae]
MWKSKLYQVKKLKEQYTGYSNSGVSDKNIEDYLKLCKENKIYIPDSYFSILKEINGFEFDGCILYGIGKQYLNVTPNEFIYDLIERNKIWHENKENIIYTYLGETNISWYVYYKNNNSYLVLDMPSGEIMEEFKDINLLIDSFFDEMGEI